MTLKNIASIRKSPPFISWVVLLKNAYLLTLSKENLFISADRIKQTGT